MIPTQIRSPSLVWSVSCDSSPFSGVLPWFHCGLIPSPPPSLHPSSSPLMPIPRTAGHANSPDLALCCYTNLPHVWFAYRFPSLLFACTTCSTTRHSATSLCLSHHLTRHSIKSCAAIFLSVSIVFITPKVSSIPMTCDPLTLVLPGLGVVCLFVYRGGVGCSNCFYSF